MRRLFAFVALSRKSLVTCRTSCASHNDEVHLGGPQPLVIPEKNPHVPNWNKIEALTNEAPKIVLMGDSVLDNFIWLNDPKNHLRVQLDNLTSKDRELKDYKCINLAVDQMTSFDFVIRNRSNDWRNYEEGKRQVRFPSLLDQQYFVATDHTIYSIENLRNLRNVRYVVVSIGGNDVYLKPEIQMGLAKSILPFQKNVRDKIGCQFGIRIRKIFQLIKQAAPEATIIPVIVYHPHYEFSISGINDGVIGWVAKTVQKYLLSTLVSPMVKEILYLAQEEKLPVIDLSRTLDANNAHHYGTGDIKTRNHLGAPWSGAEPSNVGSQFIAQLATHIMKNAKSDRSIVYFGQTRGDHMTGVASDWNQGSYPEWYAFGRKTNPFTYGYQQKIDLLPSDVL